MGNYFTLVTDSGTQKMLEAMHGDNKVKITEFAVGDGAGIPSASAAGLKNEIWRGTVNAAYVSEESGNVFIVESVIPADVGGFTIREMGIFDEEGTMIAVCNTPDTHKVKVTDGVVHELSLAMELLLSNTDSVEIVVDPNVVVATKKDIEKLTESKADKDHIHLLDLDIVEAAFRSVFTHLGVTFASSMSAEEIREALQTGWNGESSSDPLALSAEEVTAALENGWNGETSADPNALSKEAIREAISI